MWKGIKV